MFDVCVVGSANLDLVARTARLPGPGETVLGSDFAEHPGGKGLNQAVAAARGGAATCFVGAVGADAAGTVLVAELVRAGVDVTAVEVHDDEPTGRALIAVDDDAENAIVVVAGANGRVTARNVPAARVVLVQLEIPVDAVERALWQGRHAGAVTVLNPAPAPAAALRADVLRAVDVIVPNEHEAARLGGAGVLLAAGVGAVVTTRGSDSVRLATATSSWEQATFVVDPADTTGAGDAFCGVLSARLAIGDALATAVRYATAAGALAATVAGAVPSMPDEAAIAALVATLSGGSAGPPSRRG